MNNFHNYYLRFSNSYYLRFTFIYIYVVIFGITSKWILKKLENEIKSISWLEEF